MLKKAMTEVDDDLRVSMEYSRSQGTRILQIHYDRGLTWGKLRRQYWYLLYYSLTLVGLGWSCGLSTVWSGIMKTYDEKAWSQ